MLDLFNAIPRGLVLPPASLLLLIAAGLVLAGRWPRAGRAIAACALVALIFLSSAAGTRLLVAPLEAMSTPLLAPERAGAQAIVVLAAGRVQQAPEYGGRDIPDYVALARVRYAAHLQRRTGLPVLVSGGNGSSGRDADADDRAYSKAGAMADALREDFGVPVKWIEPRSRDTQENAACSAALLRAAGVHKVLLVTDAMHMPRAHSAFTRAGLDVVDAPTLFFSRQPQKLEAFVPSAEGMRRGWYAMYEWIGMAWYRLRASTTASACPM